MKYQKEMKYQKAHGACQNPVNEAPHLLLLAEGKLHRKMHSRNKQSWDLCKYGSFQKQPFPYYIQCPWDFSQTTPLSSLWSASFAAALQICSCSNSVQPALCEAFFSMKMTEIVPRGSSRKGSFIMTGEMQRHWYCPGSTTKISEPLGKKNSQGNQQTIVLCLTWECWLDKWPRSENRHQVSHWILQIRERL